MKKFKIKNHRAVLTVLILILCLLSFLYYDLIFRVSYASNYFATQAEKIAEQNDNPIFKIQKIIVYSSANAIDKSENGTLKDLSIFQYSDIAIYLDNTSTVYDMTNENTVKQLYIDNINIKTNSDMGHQYINYKNALDFAKYKKIQPNDNR
ncbi:MAG: hypothetical protein ACLS90_06175, partial [Clostridia bacterium]